MKTIYISFKSRNEVLEFSSFLKYNHIAHRVTDTPRAISSSCGLSITTSISNLNTISSILSRSKVQTYLGVFLVEQNGTNQVAKRLF